MTNTKKLIVYYSYTGHTKMIAKEIKKKLSCDILELKPQIPYSSDYQTVVEEEQNNSSNDKEGYILSSIGCILNASSLYKIKQNMWYNYIKVINKQNLLSGDM